MRKYGIFPEDIQFTHNGTQLNLSLRGDAEFEALVVMCGTINDDNTFNAQINFTFNWPVGRDGADTISDDELVAFFNSPRIVGGLNERIAAQFGDFQDSETGEWTDILASRLRKLVKSRFTFNPAKGFSLTE